MTLDDLYQDIILEHYRQPRNRLELSDADKVIEGKNPFCGDEISVYIKLDGEVVERVTFTGKGCAISQASASLMTEAVKGKTLGDTLEIIADFKKMIKGGSVRLEMQELTAFQGMSQFPTRIKCALLSWNTLERGLSEIEAIRSSTDGDSDL
jgi:nitrogen fixation NifU-like protein